MRLLLAHLVVPPLLPAAPRVGVLRPGESDAQDRGRGVSAVLGLFGTDPPERIGAWLATVTATAVRALDLSLLLDLLHIDQDPDRWGTLMTLVPPSLEVVVNVEESQLGQLAEGQAVQLNVAAFPGQPFDGVLRAINPTLDTKTRTASVHVVPNNLDGKLRAGMSTDVVIQTAHAENAIIVPPAALQQRSGQQFVFTAVDGRARMQLVNIGLSNPTAIQITSGVQPGDTVILPGSITLSDGESIVASTPPTTASAPPVARNGG